MLILVKNGSSPLSDASLHPLASFVASKYVRTGTLVTKSFNWSIALTWISDHNHAASCRVRSRSGLHTSLKRGKNLFGWFASPINLRTLVTSVRVGISSTAFPFAGSGLSPFSDIKWPMKVTSLRRNFTFSLLSFTFRSWHRCIKTCKFCSWSLRTLVYPWTFKGM